MGQDYKGPDEIMKTVEEKDFYCPAIRGKCVKEKCVACHTLRGIFNERHLPKINFMATGEDKIRDEIVICTKYNRVLKHSRIEKCENP